MATTLVQVTDDLVLTEDTTWDRTHRYELSSVVTVMPGVTLTIRGSKVPDGDDAAVQVSFQSPEASISVRTGAALRMDHVDFIASSNSQVEGILAYNTSVPIEIDRWRCEGAFLSCIQLQDSFDTSLIVRQAEFTGVRQGIGSTAANVIRSDRGREEILVEDLTCRDIQQQCVGGRNLIVRNTTVETSGQGLVVYTDRSLVADGLVCRQLHQACLNGVYGGADFIMSNVLVVDCPAVLQTGSYAHGSIDISDSLFLRNEFVLECSARQFKMRSSMLAYNQRGIDVRSFGGPIFSVTATLFVGNGVAFYGADGTLIQDVMFYENDVAVQPRRSSGPPYLCTALTNVTFLQNDVALVTSAPFGKGCSGGGNITGWWNRTNLLDSRTAHVLYTGRVDALSAEGLFWGTTDVDRIRIHIPDVFDDATYGVVNLEPVADAFFSHPLVPDFETWVPPDAFLGEGLQRTQAPTTTTNSPNSPSPTRSPIALPHELESTRPTRAPILLHRATFVPTLGTNSPRSATAPAATPAAERLDTSSSNQDGKTTVLMGWNFLLTVAVLVLFWRQRGHRQTTSCQSRQPATTRGSP